MHKFLAGLPEGADVETSFYSFADELEKIKDPAERARLAMDKFGKSGVDMVKIAGQGSGAIRQLAGEFSKFSKSDIEAVEDASRRIEEVFSTITIWIGKFIGAYAMMYKIMGATTSTLNPVTAYRGIVEAEQREESARKQARAQYEQATAIQKAADALAEYYKGLDDITLKSGTFDQKLDIITKRFMAECDAAEKATDATEAYAHLLAAAQLNQDANDLWAAKNAEDARAAEEERRKQEEADKKSEETAKRRAKLEREITEDRERAVEGIVAGYQPSIEELANSGGMVPFRNGMTGGLWRMRFQPGPFAGMAQEIEGRTADAKRAFIYGDLGRANFDINRSEQLKDALGAMGIIPVDHAKNMDRHLENLNEQISEMRSQGLPVTIENAED